MFDLARSSPFFEAMDAEHPTLVQNIDIVAENRRSLDVAYHQPKHFILSLNNLLRSLLFFVENSVKNSPLWLHDSVCTFRDSRRKDYEILRYLRNVSAHQKLVFPDESLVGGLFRIRSSGNYLLKLGFGDHGKPGSYAHDLTLRNTEDIFDDMLAFSSMAFMDLEHSALGECLGITRRWFYRINFKFDEGKIHEIIDVYQIASEFSTSLLDHVCAGYADYKKLPYEQVFSRKLEEHNYINTLLEVDLYPSLFSSWWEDNIRPLNYGVQAARLQGDRCLDRDKYYSWVFDNLTPDGQSYCAALAKFSQLTAEEIVEQSNISAFISFVTVNHWHFKKAFPSSFDSSPVSPAEVMMLQRLGRMFLDECESQKLCTISAAKDQLNRHMEKMLQALDSWIRPGD